MKLIALLQLISITLFSHYSFASETCDYSDTSLRQLRMNEVKKEFLKLANSKSKNSINQALSGEDREAWEGVPSTDKNGLITESSIKVIQTYAEFSYVFDDERAYLVSVLIDLPTRPVHSDEYLGNYARESSNLFRCSLSANNPCLKARSIVCEKANR